MKKTINRLAVLMAVLTLLLGPSLQADSRDSTSTILEAIAKNDPSNSPSDDLSIFTLKRTKDTEQWLLEQSTGSRTLTGRLEELARFSISAADLPNVPIRRARVQADVVAQYVLVGTLDRSETRSGIQIWGLVQEVISERSGKTKIFIPMGSASDPSVAIEQATILVNSKTRSRTGPTRSSSQIELFGICNIDCASEYDLCSQIANSQLASCVDNCPPPTGPLGFAAHLLCLDVCGALWIGRNASCFANFLTCQVLQTACPASPILLDLDRNAFHLAGLDNSVPFDINADGQTEEISWTQWNQNDVFLCLDRNQNGRIDNGSELFGNHTPLHFGSTAPNGYIALAEFDMEHLGGNDDGFIDKDDTIYKDLCVWKDSNHNGFSEANELSNLKASGVARIGLRYESSREIDQHGNELRYWSHAWIQDDEALRHTLTVDVFFVVGSN